MLHHRCSLMAHVRQFYFRDATTVPLRCVALRASDARMQWTRKSKQYRGGGGGCVRVTGLHSTVYSTLHLLPVRWM
jgi:hypothetical protein